MAGIVAGLRTTMSRRGKMLVMTLDDMSARVDVTVFNEVFDAQRAVFREDELLCVLGKVSKDDYTGGLRVTAERVCDLPEARASFAKRLRVRLNGIADGAALRVAIEPFSRAVRQGAAGVPVVLEYGNAQAACAVELGTEWRVRPSDDLLEAVRATLHPQQLGLEY
jgi:DNA polymerase-3 subunit alpha